MSIKYWYFLALGILIIDQVTKVLTDGVNMPFIDGFISFQSVQNTGASFSMLEGAQWLFIALAVVFIVGMILFDILFKKDLRFNGWYKVGFVLLLGGIIGNLIDRICFGYVRDFICLDFMNFPIFNVADMALTVGTICLVVWLLFFCGHTRNVVETTATKVAEDQNGSDNEQDGQKSTMHTQDAIQSELENADKDSQSEKTIIEGK